MTARHERWGAMACVLAPASWLAAQMLLSSMRPSGSALERIAADPVAWLWSHVLLLVAAFAWVVVGGYLALLAGRTRAAYAGLGLVLAGSVVTAVTASADLVVGAASGRPDAASVHRAVVDSVLRPLDPWSLLTTYGLVLLALACLRARALPTPVLVVLLVALAVPATGELRVVSSALQMAAWVAAAAAVWNGRRAGRLPPGWVGLVVLAPYVVVAPLSWQRAGLCVLVAAWFGRELLARRTPSSARR